MAITRNFKNWIHGWFPQEPKIGIIRSINTNLKPGRWVPLPSISGLLLIAAALVSFYFGSTYIRSYESNYNVFIAGLPIAILQLAACALELLSAALLLTRKYTSIAVAGMVTVLLLGVSLPLIIMFDQPTTVNPSYIRYLFEPGMWQSGLFLGSPMIAFSAAGLIIVALNRRRQQGTQGISAAAAAAAAATALAVFWSILAAANIVQTNGLANLFETSWLIHLSLPEQFAWLLGGVALGTALGIVITRLQINRLPKETKNHSRIRGWLLTIGTAVAVILLFVGFLSLDLPADILYGSLSGVFGGIAAVFAARAALFLFYEKRQGMWIRQNGLETFAASKEVGCGVEGGSVLKRPIVISLKSVMLSSFVAVGFFALIFVLHDSWIRMVLIAAAVLGCLVMLTAKGKLRSAAKYTVVSLMVFSLCFSTYESLTFAKVGYQPVNVPSPSNISSIRDVSIEGMGNISINAILHDIKQSEAVNLLKLEHHDISQFRSMEIYLAQEGQGHIAVEYSTKNPNESVYFVSYYGNQYSVDAHDDYRDRENVTSQSLENSFNQIDALGLEWFYNQALEIAHNRTATLQTIDSVAFSFNYNTNHECITVGILAHHSNPGSSYSSQVVNAEFQSDGTFVYMWTPREDGKP